jgi:hypothetical protein
VNGKALAQQLEVQDLAIVLVTFDENDAAKLGLADGGRLCRSGRREHVALPPIERPVPFGRRRQGRRSI